MRQRSFICAGFIELHCVENAPCDLQVGLVGVAPVQVFAGRVGVGFHPPGGDSARYFVDEGALDGGVLGSVSLVPDGHAQAEDVLGFQSSPPDVGIRVVRLAVLQDGNRDAVGMVLPRRQLGDIERADVDRSLDPRTRKSTHHRGAASRDPFMETKRRFLPRSNIGKVIDYALEQWSSLLLYLDDCRERHPPHGH